MSQGSLITWLNLITLFARRYQVMCIPEFVLPNPKFQLLIILTQIEDSEWVCFLLYTRAPILSLNHVIKEQSVNSSADPDPPS